MQQSLILCRAGLTADVLQRQMPVAYEVKLWGQRWCFVLKCICLILPHKDLLLFFTNKETGFIEAESLHQGHKASTQ